MMRQSFVWKPEFPEVILFPGAKVNSIVELVITCGVFVLLGIVLETLRCIRTIIVVTSRKKTTEVTMGSKQHIVETIIFVVELVFGYCLMLVVMSFNLWLGIAVVMGSAIGYLLCGTITNRFRMRMEHKAAKSEALLTRTSEGHRRHLVEDEANSTQNNNGRRVKGILKNPEEHAEILLEKNGDAGNRSNGATSDGEMVELASKVSSL